MCLTIRTGYGMNEPMTDKPILGGTPEWHEARNGCVTGTWVASLFGESPWKSTDDLMERLTMGRAELKSRYLWWGQHDEEHIAMAYGQIVGATIRPANIFRRRGSLGATIDATMEMWDDKARSLFAENPLPVPDEVTSAPSFWRKTMLEVEDLGPKKLILEIKTTAEKNRALWGRQVPRHVWWQVQAQMWCHDLTETVVVTKLGAHDIRHNLVRYEDGIGPIMEEAAAEILEEVGL